MAFHVRVWWPNSNWAYALNLTEEDVKRRFVEPWLRAQPVVAQGIHFNVGYWRVEVREYATVPETGEAYMVWIYQVSKGKNVTDRFITKPYGADRPPEAAQPSTPPDLKPTHAVDPRTVMVVHGRDLGIRDAMFAFLRALDLAPLEWSQLVRLTGEGSPYVGRVLQRAFEVAQAAVVIFSPDDETRLAERLWRDDEDDDEKDLRAQARPNVFFEAGLAFGRFPEKTVLVEVGRLRPASDLAGRHVVRLDNSPQRRQELAQRLEDAGCQVDRSGSDWLNVGSFEL
jgi:predicted nucleotide-binding protein